MDISRFQCSAITEHHVYLHLGHHAKGDNRDVLLHLARDKKKEYDFWKGVTKKSVKPKQSTIRKYIWLGSFFGLSFALHLMERKEGVSLREQKMIVKEYPSSKKIFEAQAHEKRVLKGIKEDHLSYAGSIVLGLNDALVELSGALVGFTFALQDGRVIGVSGLIVGAAASLSMAASGYLSSEEDGGKNSLKSAMYTGVAYFLTVILLVAPYFLFSPSIVAMLVMLCIVLLIIFGYSYYISIAKDEGFWKRFSRMACISLSVALVSFLVGKLLKGFFNV